MCDTSVHLFFRYIEHKPWKIGAVTEWLTPTLNPSVVFHYEWLAPNPTVRHSLFEITSRHGNNFAADFTVVQLGFKPSMRFQTREDYLAKCVIEGELPAAEITEVTETAMRRQVDVTGMRKVVQERCDNFDMCRWKTLDGQTRMDWLRRLVTEACERGDGG